MRCPVCTAPTVESRRYAVTEYMLHTGDVFHYEPCSACGSSAIVDPPRDLGRYYPRTYTAFAPRGRFISGVLRVRRRLGFDERVRAFERLGADRGARVLDVGCASGDFLQVLRSRGFRDLTGLDPFLPFEPAAGGAIHFIKGDLDAVRDARFDVVTAHHVIEHAPDTRRFVAQVAAVLAPGGRALIRTPLFDSWAAQRYGPLWIQHDAPRHLVLPTSGALVQAAEAAGLRLVEAWRDEGRWQAWGTARLAAGRNPFDPSSIPTKLGRFRYSAAAARRNRQGSGDQGCFVFTPRAPEPSGPGGVPPAG